MYDLPMPSRRLGALLSVPIATGLLGVVVLRGHGVAAPRLALMLGAIAAGAIVAAVLAATGRDLLDRLAPVLAVGALALLATTLLGEGLLDVRRWLALGPIRLHASSISCPVLLAASASLSSRARGAWAAVALAAAQAIHVAQPDAGQSTALAAGVLVGLARWPAPLRVRVVGLGAVAASIVPAWIRADPLPPVPEVEGIVRLAGELGRPIQVVAVVLLALVPASLAVAARSVSERRPGGPVARATCAALAAYVAGTVLVPVLGNFPVPVLGFGVSPVLGVGICVGFAAALGEPA
jgi:cell division protein FtsW (lipid II flippase)